MSPIGIYEAKKQLSRLVRESSEHLQFFEVKNAQRTDAPHSWVVGETAVAIVLENLQCHPEWEEDAEQGLCTVYVPELDLWGQGKSKEEAAEDLVDAALDYADVFKDDVAFYVKAGRKQHLGYVWRIYLAHGDRDQIKELLGLR